jgi:hypothetical protein
MSSGHKLRSPGEGSSEEGAKLDLSVTSGTGERSAPCRILLTKWGDNVCFKLPLGVDEIVRNPEVGCHQAGIIYGFECAAAVARKLGRSLNPVTPDLQGHPDHVVPFFLKQGGGDGTVHPTTHRHNHPGTHGKP